MENMTWKGIIGMMKFWINHPATDGPVSFKRWLQWQAGSWLWSVIRPWERRAEILQWKALYPGRPYDEIPF